MSSTSKKMSDFKVRLSISLLLAISVAFLIAFSDEKWVGTILVFTAATVAAVGVWEYVQLARAKNLKIASKLMIGLTFCLTIVSFTSQKFLDTSFLPLAILALGLACFFIFHFKETSNAIALIAVEFFGVCYVAFPVSFMLGILYPSPSQDGRWWLGYLILVTKITDVGAYFVGRLWGKHKLAPYLSPKKTVEGAIAGFICATLMSLLLYYFGIRFSEGTFRISFSDALWLGMLIGIVGQVGDLAESLLKRDAQVKDTNILPGFGGVLDLLDSLLFTAPMVYFFLRMKI